MATFVFIFLNSLIAVVLSSSSCPYHVSMDKTDLIDCDWGCCYLYQYPCCDTPFYADSPFIAGTVCGSVALVCIIIAVILYYRRRSNVTTTLHYGSPAFAQTFSTNTSISAYSGYNNPNYFSNSNTVSSHVRVY